MFRGLCTATLLSILLGTTTTFAYGFRDFRIPTHSNDALELSMFGALRSNDRDLFGDLYDEDNTSGNGTFAYYRYYDSDPWQWYLQTYVDLDRDSRDFERRNNDYNPGFMARGRFEEDRRSTSQYFYAVYSNRYYPTSLPLGFEGVISGHTDVRQSSYEYFDQRLNFNSVDRNWYDETSNELDYRLDAEVMVGWGRTRSVTRVYDVYILVERLQRAGIVEGELRDETLLKLSQHYYRRSDYSRVHEEWEKFFLRDAVEILSGDPAFDAGKFGIFESYLINEDVLDSSPLSRRIGFFTGVFIDAYHDHDQNNRHQENRYEYQTMDTTTSSSSIMSSKYDRERNDALVGCFLNIYIPVGLHWQFDFSTRIGQRVASQVEGFEFETYARAGYEFARRWRATVQLDHFRSISDFDEEKAGATYQFQDLSNWNYNLYARLDYEILDQLDLYLAFSSYQYRRRNFDHLSNIDYHSWERISEASIGFAYSFFTHSDPGIADHPVYQP